MRARLAGGTASVRAVATTGEEIGTIALARRSATGRMAPAAKARARSAGPASTTLLAIALVVSGCASDDGGGGAQAVPARVLVCKAGDRRVDGPAACLQDDAACYELDDGSWCTGARGNTCPAGSSPLPADAACPPGARCFAIGESLTCTIAFR